MSVSPDLSVADLSRVIKRIEEKSRLRPAASRRASLEDVLGGGVEETESGRVFVVRQRFDAGREVYQNICQACQPSPFSTIARVAIPKTQATPRPFAPGGGST